MVRQMSVAGLLALALCMGAQAATESATRPSPIGQKIDAEARRELHEMKHTVYQHKTNIDEATGSFLTDCSGLVSFVMSKVAPRQLDEVVHAAKRTHPLAEDFYNTMSGANGSHGWLEVKNIADAQPGDVLAYKFKQPNKNTGHVVIIDGKPEPDGKNLWRVRVIDATTKTHADDTRPEGVTGLGSGIMWFAVDADGHPIGLKRKALTEKTDPEPIAIGRAEPMKAE